MYFNTPAYFHTDCISEPLPACSGDLVRCPGQGNAGCILPADRCNQENDCRDGSDEIETAGACGESKQISQKIKTIALKQS